MFEILYWTGVMLILVSLFGCADQVTSRPVAPLDHRTCFGMPVEVYCAVSLRETECGAIEVAATWWNRQMPHTRFFAYQGHKLEPTLEHKLPQNVLVIGMTPPGLLNSLIPNIDKLIAVTAYRNHPRTGCLTASAMFFNIRPDDMSYEGAQNVLRHELGHVLGLLDSDNDEGLMMRSEDPNTDMLRDLAPGELNALRAMYY